MDGLHQFVLHQFDFAPIKRTANHDRIRRTTEFEDEDEDEDEAEEAIPRRHRRGIGNAIGNINVDQLAAIDYFFSVTVPCLFVPNDMWCVEMQYPLQTLHMH